MLTSYKSIIIVILSLCCISNSLFKSVILTILLKNDFSSFSISLSIASMALPNLLLGKLMGRFIDRNLKIRSLKIACIGLIVCEFFIIFVSDQPYYARFILPILLISISLFFSIYMMVIEQFLVPSIDVNEEISYRNWEVINKLSAIVSGFVGFIFFKYFNPISILFADILSIFILLLFCYYKRSALYEPITNSSFKIKDNNSRLKKSFKNKTILYFTSLICVYNFSILSIENNISLIALKFRSFSEEYIPSLDSFFAILGWISILIYTRFSRRDEISQNIKRLNFTLFISSIICLLIGFSVNFNMFIVFIIGFVSLALIDPIWDFETILFLRKNSPPEHFAEIFGMVRAPRAALTMLGTSSIGYFDSRGTLNSYLYVLSFFMCVYIIFMLHKSMNLVEINYSKFK